MIQENVFDSGMINQIIALIKDIFPTNMSRDYGLTFNEILNEVNISYTNLFPDLPPIQPNQLQQILRYKVNGKNQFDTIVRNDGTLLYQISQQPDAYNQYLFDYPSIYPTDPQPPHYVAPHIQSSQIPQIHQPFIQFHQIPPESPIQSQPPPSIQPPTPQYQQQVPFQLQWQFHPTIPNISIQNDQQQHQQQQQLQQAQFQNQQKQPQYMPDTIEELTKEIQKEQKKIEELKKRQEHLLICHQLLQNPVQLKAVVKKMEQTVLYLKDMRSMIDDKVKDLVTYLT